ncbi:hypothetical protein [Streptomyces sp. NRRL S-1448]|uniref:hypothetical protein n=1 Tax=Streptomyces sp. NRRL S-1448 TaxID=1463883 RepID=UPI00131D38D3|nr:hypothetical protein [Streptomyces sp. NRRL S-1448]
MTKQHDVPEDGLAEVLRGWSSTAKLYAALAAVADDWVEVAWTQTDLERRAQRVLYDDLLPGLAKWPARAADWTDALPASSHRERRTSTAIGPGVHWVETRNQGRWPPVEYVAFDRNRVADQVMATTLRWVIDEVALLRRAALNVDPSLKDKEKLRVEAALEVRTASPIDAAIGQVPTRTELHALSRSGYPWTAVAPVAKVLVNFRNMNVLEFARRHLMPIDKLRWRLFHLGVLGVLLKSLRDSGWRLVSHRPLSASEATGPHYKAHSQNGEIWDIWFEAERMWKYYGVESSYESLMKSAFGKSSPMGADVAIVSPGHRAYLFECKYGSVSYVSRDGFHQISTYVAEVAEKLSVVAEGYIVGPDDVVTNNASELLAGARLNVVGPRHLASFQP